MLLLFIWCLEICHVIQRARLQHTIGLQRYSFSIGESRTMDFVHDTAWLTTRLAVIEVVTRHLLLIYTKK